MSNRRFILLAIAGSLAALLVAYLLLDEDRLRAKPRREWKDQAIARIEQRLADESWIRERAAKLSAVAPTTRPSWRPWYDDEMIVMANGEWLICQSVCSKQDARINDLFLGRGSDGRWYYSTFHFCIDKMSLIEERRPENLAQFVTAYWLTPFDGRSSECLNETWIDKGSWGEARLQESSTGN